MVKKRQAILSPDFVREAVCAARSGNGGDYDLKNLVRRFCDQAKTDDGAWLELQQLIAWLLERAMRNEKKFDDAFDFKQREQRGRKIEWSYHRKALLVVEMDLVSNAGNNKKSLASAAVILSRREPWATLMKDKKDAAGTLKKQRDNFLREFRGNDAFKSTLDNLRAFSNDLGSDQQKIHRWESLVKALFNFGEK